MCNFVIRPIKSYATADTNVVSDDGVHKVKRGTAVKVISTNEHGVLASIESKEYLFTYDQFIHCFTANPADIKTVKDEEAKWFSKPEAKESK